MIDEDRPDGGPDEAHRAEDVEGIRPAVGADEKPGDGEREDGSDGQSAREERDRPRTLRRRDPAPYHVDAGWKDRRLAEPEGDTRGDEDGE